MPCECIPCYTSFMERFLPLKKSGDIRPKLLLGYNTFRNGSVIMTQAPAAAAAAAAAAPTEAPKPEVPLYHLSHFVTADVPKGEDGRPDPNHPKMQELTALCGQEVRIRGFLHIKRETKRITFLVIRQKLDTFQIAFQVKQHEAWFA